MLPLQSVPKTLKQFPKVGSVLGRQAYCVQKFLLRIVPSLSSVIEHLLMPGPELVAEEEQNEITAATCLLCSKEQSQNAITL